MYEFGIQEEIQTGDINLKVIITQISVKTQEWKIIKEMNLERNYKFKDWALDNSSVWSWKRKQKTNDTETKESQL